jgi:hypothetical protein
VLPDMTQDNRLACGGGRNSIAVLGEKLNVLRIGRSKFEPNGCAGPATAVAASGSCVAMYSTPHASVSTSCPVHMYYMYTHTVLLDVDVLDCRLDCNSNTRSVLHQQAAAVVACGAHYNLSSTFCLAACFSPQL